MLAVTLVSAYVHDDIAVLISFTVLYLSSHVRDVYCLSTAVSSIEPEEGPRTETFYILIRMLVPVKTDMELFVGEY